MTHQPNDPTASHERLIEGLTLDPTGDFFLTYSDEASVRRAVATLARAYGWPIVREEVVIPGWGRVDLLLQMDEKAAPHLIELKLDLSRPSLIRKAFQQADGYGRWWQATHSQEPYVYLSMCTGDAAAISAVMNAYPLIECQWVGTLMKRLPLPQHSSAERLAVARERIDSTERQLKLQRRALEILQAEYEAWEAQERDDYSLFSAMAEKLFPVPEGDS